MKGKIIHVKGDATTPQKVDSAETVIIPHVCNDIGAWGAGFVLALSRKWDKPEADYKAFCKFGPKLNRALLGQTIFSKAEQGIIVANMVAQKGVRSSNPDKKPIRYSALVDCMRQVAEALSMFGSSVPVRIHCPKFGSDLAGGTWAFIEELITEIWLPYCDVVVYEYVPQGAKVDLDNE